MDLLEKEILEWRFQHSKEQGVTNFRIFFFFFWGGIFGEEIKEVDGKKTRN